MKPHPVPPDEIGRLAALRRYGIMDTPPEPAFDDLTRLAAQVCGAPFAVITLLDRERQWLKSRIGMETADTPRELTFCTHTVLGRTTLVVPDALADPRFSANPMVAVDGIRFYAGAPLITPDGHVLGALCVLDRRPRELSAAEREALEALARQVVTQLEFRRACHELEAERCFNAAVVDSASALVIVTDAEGRILRFNHTAERLMGYAAAEVLGQRFWEIFVRRTDQEVNRRRLEWFASGHGSLEAETDWITRAGEPRRIAWSLTALPGGAGAGRTIVATGTDVTVQRQDEQWLHESREALRRAKEDAEAAVRAKSEFLATVSHEIRTPMNGVLGMTGLLMDTPLTPEQRSYAETVRASAEALLGIINDILDFSKIEAGKLTFDRAPFALRRTLQDALDLLVVPVQQKRLELVTRIDDEVPPVLVGDAGRLRQVLLNLLSNAVKFTDRGRVETRVTLLERDGPDAVLRFEVQDTGIGIAPAAQARLFQPFSQADGTTTRRYGGTGLGLAISRELVERMDGRIGVDSEPGRGSTFWFTVRLPVGAAPEAVDTADAVLPTPAPPNDPGGARQKLRVLIVEDNKVNQQVARMVLTKFGHRTDVAANGLEAIEAVNRIHYDLVLMDCHMPELDGYEATVRIRNAAGPASRVPIVAMTASVMPSDRDRCFASGMDDFVTKPLEVERLRQVLERWGGRRSGNGVSDEPVDPEVLATLRSLQVSGEPDLLTELIDLFLTDLPGRCGAIRQGLETGDRRMMRDAAHSLKGSAGNLGAPTLAALCKEIEAGAADDGLAGIAAAVTRLEAEAERVKERLMEERHA